MKLRQRLKRVCGVGINDADYPIHQFSYKRNEKGNLVVDKRLWTCPYYAQWYDMLRRCYNKRCLQKHPSYGDALVCDEWLTFSNFKSWMEEQDWEGKQLDKDILSGKSKIYSPSTCCFIPPALNQFFKDRASKTSVLVGVSFRHGKYIARCMNPFTGKRESLGSFLDAQAAHDAWRERKLEHANRWADILCGSGYSDTVVNALRGIYTEEGYKIWIGRHPT